MSESAQRAHSLQRLRQTALEELEEADLALSRVRMGVERMESDLRIGLPTPAGYEALKGRDLPQAEERLRDAFRYLLKIEDKILLSGGNVVEETSE